MRVGEGWQGIANGAEQLVEDARGGLAQDGLKLGEAFSIGLKSGDYKGSTPGIPRRNDRRAHCLAFLGGQVVHNGEVA